MSYHSNVEDHSCTNCGQEFLPFSVSMNCPSCDARATKETSIVQDTLEALEWHGYAHPGGYGVFSIADKYILFACEVAGELQADDDPVEVARRNTVRIEDADDHLRLHLCRYLEEVLPSAIRGKFGEGDGGDADGGGLWERVSGGVESAAKRVRDTAPSAIEVARSSISDAREAFSDRLGELSGEAAYKEAMERLKLQQEKNQLLATTLHEALDRIATLESEMQELRPRDVDGSSG